MKRRFLLFFTVIAAVILSSGFAQQPTGAPTGAMAGYSAQDAQAERQWESKFQQIPQPANARKYMERMAAHPHAVGQPYDKDNAEWMASTLKSWGLDSRLEQFYVLMPWPKERVVEMTAPTSFKLKLQEPAVPQDPTSSQQNEQLPTFNAYSIDGDVTGPLVYVNYGVPADYEELERLGVPIKGSVVIARYGGSWRGIKPKVAAEHGAVGCLIYSDPRDDGYFDGDTFPKGPYRPPDGAQRGSVADMPVYSGDPLTPGVGATDPNRQVPSDLTKVPVITKIPVLPISYADAEPLLRAMGGPMAPARWRGALPLPYKVGGPGNRAVVHMKLSFDWKIRTLYDVITRIPGSEYPDEWIIRGNHHDGWVNGADDPLSGQSAEMEELRAYSELLKQGWKPKRTIIYAAWDGEEPGLLGSTEWAEKHAQELQQKAVMYINSDTNTRGFLGMSGSHTLEPFINSIARDIQDPEVFMPVWKRAQLLRISRTAGPGSSPIADEGGESADQQRQEARTRPDLRIGALGSGSDYTPFLQHLGIASLNLGYGGEASSAGVYHSIYDDFYWYTHFGDPEFKYARTLAQTAGTAVMRMADADLLPFSFTSLADTLKLYVTQLKTLDRNTRRQIEEVLNETHEGVYAATIDPMHRVSPPPPPEPPPAQPLDFAALDAAVDHLARAAKQYDDAVAAHNGAVPAGAKQVNALLIQSERKLLSEAGLPRREWYKHQIYAPGFYTGYGVKTIPAVREAIEQKQWHDAQQAIGTVSGIIQNEATLAEQAVSAVR